MQTDPEEAKRLLEEWERHEQAVMDGKAEEEPEEIRTFTIEEKLEDDEEDYEDNEGDFFETFGYEPHDD